MVPSFDCVQRIYPSSKCLFHTNIVGNNPTNFVGYVKKKIEGKIFFLVTNLRGASLRLLTTGSNTSLMLGLHFFGFYGPGLTGSFYTLLVILVLSFPIGVAAAVYLEEFAPRDHSRHGSGFRGNRAAAENRDISL